MRPERFFGFIEYDRAAKAVRFKLFLLCVGCKSSSEKSSLGWYLKVCAEQYMNDLVGRSVKKKNNEKEKSTKVSLHISRMRVNAALNVKRDE